MGHFRRRGFGLRLSVLGAVVSTALAGAPSALADEWLPHPSDATWTWEWSDTVYNPTPTREQVTVKSQSGKSFTLAWTSFDQGNPPDAFPSVGTITFQESTAGLVNTDWSSGPPPTSFPILCAVQTSCNNSLASAYYLLIWGARAPVLASPVLSMTGVGCTWRRLGRGIERERPIPLVELQAHAQAVGAGIHGRRGRERVRALHGQARLGPATRASSLQGALRPAQRQSMATSSANGWISRIGTGRAGPVQGLDAAAVVAPRAGRITGPATACLGVGARRCTLRAVRLWPRAMLRAVARQRSGVGRI